MERYQHYRESTASIFRVYLDKWQQVTVGSSAILVFMYIKMHHILEGSDHNKICPLQQEEFSNDKRFRNALKFIDQI